MDNVFPARVGIDDPSRVSEVRRRAAACARQEQLDELRTAEVALVATELATNLVKHAVAGELHIAPLSWLGEPGVELIAIDRGPGFRDLESCLADGYSTAGTPGNGLGAIVRLSTEFDGYSLPGKGTVLVSRCRGGSPATGCHATTVGGLIAPIRGEEVSGDAWTVRCHQGRLTVLVSDGLGHGVLAAQASSAAVDAFWRTSESSPSGIVEVLHRALKGTRGAALAVASLELDSRRIRFAGLGNIGAVALGGPKPQYLLSHNGTAGHHSTRIQEFDYPLPDPGLVVMHSDGLVSSWTLDAYPGLQRRHPAVVAGVLYRDASRGRDDVCVVVVGSESQR
ncbi:MAG: SpoIIE family protein phosphatase [Bryobacteraceae bacterium]|nr:SpoIIE family protein phosphatase [Bryobacteraceae bacterium]